jgi:AcrR family transcriptional regulator
MSVVEPPSRSGPQRLPSGRHGLSRDAVVRSQRERLLEAMIATVNEKGYRATTIVEVAERAGVSRKTFYELFGDKEGCFHAAFDWLYERLIAYIRPAWERPGAWHDRVRRALAALLTAIAYRPEGARLAVIETIAVGPRAHQRYRAAVRSFVPYLDEGRNETPFGDQLPRSVSRVVVGGAASLIFEQVATGQASELRELYPELLFFVLLPYLGHERALQEMQNARARRPATAAATAS